MLAVTAHKSDEHASIVALSASIPWLQLLAWAAKYGLPLLKQASDVLLPLLVTNPNLLKMIEYGEAVLIALANNQPIPQWQP